MRANASASHHARTSIGRRGVRAGGRDAGGVADVFGAHVTVIRTLRVWVPRDCNAQSVGAGALRRARGDGRAVARRRVPVFRMRTHTGAVTHVRSAVVAVVRANEASGLEQMGAA